MSAFRFGTWNVREGVPLPGLAADRLVDPVDLADGSDLDVLVLQEVAFDDHARSELVAAIAARTGLRRHAEYVLSPSAFSSGARSGLAVCSRYPLRRVRRTCLPNPSLRQGSMATYDKGLLTAEVRVGGTDSGTTVPVHVTSLHNFPFHLFAREADEPAFDPIWKTIATAIEPPSDDRFVVGGDFNSRDTGLVTDRLPGRPLRRAVGADGPTGDDVLYGDGLALRNLAVVDTFSDHPLFIVELEIGPTRHGRLA